MATSRSPGTQHSMPPPNQRAASVVLLGALLTAGTMSGCTEPSSGSTTAAASEPVAETAAVAEAFSIDAPGGTYEVDRTHADLAFSVPHMGLSNYVARFTDYSVTIDLDPAAIGNSSVTVSIDSASITTDYDADYKATHADSPFDTWDEDLARSDKFFDADTHPQISFVSTSIEEAGGDRLTISGELTLLGETRPITLDAQLTGALTEHPFTSGGALGFSVRGSFTRSDFGMDYLVNPPVVGDEVTLLFEGEFHQAQQG